MVIKKASPVSTFELSRSWLFSTPLHAPVRSAVDKVAVDSLATHMTG